MNKSPPKFTTKSAMVDITTGELIEPIDEPKYTKLSKEITTNANASRTRITRHIIWLCEPSKQLTLFD